MITCTIFLLILRNTLLLETQILKIIYWIEKNAPFLFLKKNETVPNFTSILDNMKYKKIIELLPAYTLFIFLLSSNSACSNGQANNKQTEDAVTDTITTFVYPEVPTMLNTPELRADYLARHYWEHVNFADTNYIHHPEVTEQAWVNFIDILQLVPAQTRDIALKTLFTLIPQHYYKIFFLST